VASFTLREFVNAPIDVVFDVLTDHRAYSEITPLRASTLEREGDPAPNGVGAIRVLSAVGPPIREQVTEYERPTRFAYRMLSGAPTRDHVGTVTLEAQTGGTVVTYVVETFPTLPPVLAPAFVAVARHVMVGPLFKAIAKRAEQRAASTV
jgi:uncharacterized protein YndB with AHSA1/START domain